MSKYIADIVLAHKNKCSMWLRLCVISEKWVCREIGGFYAPAVKYRQVVVPHTPSVSII